MNHSSTCFCALLLVAHCAPPTVAPTTDADAASATSDVTALDAPADDGATAPPSDVSPVDTGTVPTTGDASCLAGGAACMSGGECCSGACTADHTCWLGARISCTTDTSCPSGMICQPCDSQCVYPPTGACDSRAPCPCGYSCINAQCQTNDATLAAATHCATNADCAVNMFCNQAVFECQAPMWLSGSPTGACSTNADCGYREVCSTMAGSGACYANSTATCRDRSDCPAGYYNCTDAHQCVHFGC